MTNTSPAPVAPSAPAANGGLAADEYVRGQDLDRMAPKIVQDAMRPDIDALFASQASANLEVIKREFPDAFAKYSPTILNHLSRVDNRSRTVDNLRTIVKLSLADHLDEIVRNARREASHQEPALRSTGAPPVSVTPSPLNDLSVKSERLPAEYREKLAKAGVTEAVMDDFCRANNMTRGQFIALFDKKTAITEAPRQ